ncbi:YbgI/family dinuclear metal center protein [Cyphellophora europaea CBS 101466]|uniref:YbgI/family dinuclear metal center protein n=1 Tax=Cyphellophora europaea (strain CBS 101466) TaxID=1220924 RepID=W2SBU3_CYPE1|nr:YbgI/family dinuclear metal center protein [Cyphellophora europaea CBS 101466]ETN45483.1 YbgI/family dinuclear metal center protein [Cyphellophora europaea CBS 101466]
MASPFTKAVVSSMRTLYPECLADKSFDNTGLLLEAPFLRERRNRNSVLLTIDLTKAVAEEAIQNKHSVVVAYHPIIFRGLKSITLGDTQQHTLLRLAAHGISVYSPHTAVDIVPGGMGDWLCDVVTGKIDPRTAENYTAGSSPSSITDRSTSASESSPPVNASNASNDQPADPSTPKPKTKRPTNPHRAYSKPTYPRPTAAFHSNVLSHKRSVITPSPSAALSAANALTDSDTYTSENTGSGRILTFDTPQPLTILITRIAHAIGLPKGFPVAIPQSSLVEDILVRTVGICPGSGASVISRASSPPDLIFTGEMSHHEALAVTERGGCVVSLFHSNSERGYLWGVFRDRLEQHLNGEWEQTRKQWKKEGGSWEDGIEEILEDESVEVVVSERDRDPYGIVVLEESEVQGITLGVGTESEDDDR